MNATKIVVAEDPIKWNEFVLSNPHSNYCHLYEWQQIIKETYNLSSLYLTALDEKENILALLPITKIRNIKLKKMGVSVAFNGYGGVLQNDSTNEVSWENLFCEFIFKYTKINQIEIRQLGELCNPENLEDTQEASMILNLPDSEEQLWKDIGSKVRNQIRKAEKTGVNILEQNDIDGFYNVYAKNVGRLGTPVHKKLFFKKIKEHFKERALFITAQYEDKTIGGMLIIDHKQTSSDPFASTLQEFNQYNPNMLMYWHAIKRAQKNNLKFFDMGRSQMSSGTYKFKKQWGAKPYTLDNKTITKDLNKNQNQANINLYRSNSMQKLSTIWSALPFPLQKFAGPYLRKYIP